MRFKQPKRRTYRQKFGNEWIAVYADKYEPNTWNIGCCIHKSKRAQNDWYTNKKNKRVRAVKLNSVKRQIKSILCLWELFNKALNTIDSKDIIIIYTVNEANVKTINRYITKLNFFSTRTDVGCFWVKPPD